MTPSRIAIVGGGISGLTAAFQIAQARLAGAPVEGHLFEASPRLGGSIRTERVEGCLIECGADSFLTEKPEAIDLCHQLGLTPQLIGSEDHQRKTWILHQGALVALPDGFDFLVPTRPWSVLRTPLLSWRDKLALATEPFRTPHKKLGDEPVAHFVERHFSRGLVENVVDPLLTAVYGGDAQQLSARAVLPRFVEMERTTGSLIRGMRRAGRARRKAQGAAGGDRPPIFTTLRYGLDTLLSAMQIPLAAERVHFSRPVANLTPIGPAPGGYRLHFAAGDTFDADAVVLALPAPEAGRLLRELDAELARQLKAIPYSSSLIVAVAYEAEKVPNLPPGFGFLVPRGERSRLLACTFMGQKFSGRVPRELVLFRCFLGGTRDPGVLDLPDEHITGLVHLELETILHFSAQPKFVRVYRWPHAIAQYTVGHLERVAAIRARLEHHHAIFLAGNALDGIGVPDCVRSGKEAALACLRLARG